jgi:hypothetical protein
MTVTAPDTLSDSRVYQTKSVTPGLLSRFIKQHQELQNYKYVRHPDWVVAMICVSNGSELTNFPFLGKGRS